MTKKITSIRVGNCYYFYYGKTNITMLWTDFFSSLKMEQEQDCVSLFLKKYKKLLNSWEE